MAYFKCTGGLNPTGNAVAGDVKSGKTFSNANGIDLVGTFAAQEKTVTSSRSAQTVTPDSGKYLSKVTVNALAPTGTYTPTSRAANIDMGATSNYRYVTTTSVPNSNSGTYTYPANSTGGTVDMGATNTYRYVNADKVYAKGKADGSGSVKVAYAAGKEGATTTMTAKVNDLFYAFSWQGTITATGATKVADVSNGSSVMSIWKATSTSVKFSYGSEHTGKAFRFYPT